MALHRTGDKPLTQNDSVQWHTYTSPVLNVLSNVTLNITLWTVYSNADQRKHQSSASLAFVRRIHRWPLDSPHKGSITLKKFPFDDVIMISADILLALTPPPPLTNPEYHIMNRLFKRRSKKTSKLRVTGLCEENSPMTAGFPAQRVDNAEKVSIWWRHYDICWYSPCFNTPPPPPHPPTPHPPPPPPPPPPHPPHPTPSLDKMATISQTMFSDAFFCEWQCLLYFD